MPAGGMTFHDSVSSRKASAIRSLPQPCLVSFFETVILNGLQPAKEPDNDDFRNSVTNLLKRNVILSAAKDPEDAQSVLAGSSFLAEVFC